MMFWKRKNDELVGNKPKRTGGMDDTQRLEMLYQLAVVEELPSIVVTRHDMEWIMCAAPFLLSAKLLETDPWGSRDDNGRVVIGYYRGMPVVESYP